MCHSTPATYLVWTLLSSLLGIFFVYHLWCFDRFRCLRWNQGTQGTFKRVMTYSYLLTMPLIIAYAAGFCAIKYSEGFITLPGFGVIPTPYQLWKPAHRQAITPLYMCLTLGWALEMVTHLEELWFWMFVVNAGPEQKDWFDSLYFKAWMVGSGIAVTYMPLVTFLTRSDPLKCEMYTMLAGSLGSLSLTLWFLPVLYLFRPFLDGLRKEGVDMNTIIRLTKFHELNTIRIIFRLFFAVPLLILSVDGIRPHHHINESHFGIEFLAILSGFGVVVSSGITLVIFFPRSIENELAARDAGIRRCGLFWSRNHLTRVSQEQELYGMYDPDEIMPVDSKDSLYQKPMALPPSTPPRGGTPVQLPPAPAPALSLSTEQLTRLIPNRRRGSLDSSWTPTVKMPRNNAERFNNPAAKDSRLIKNFQSPIDLGGRSRR